MIDSLPAVRPDMDATMQSIYELVRLISAVEGVLVIVLIFWQVALLGGWRILDASNRFRLSGVALLATAGAYGSVESWIADVPGGVRTILVAVALGYVAIAYGMTVSELRERRET